MRPEKEVFGCFRRFLAGCLVGYMPFVVYAQELVSFPAAQTSSGSGSEKVEAIYSRPSTQNVGAKLPAIVLLHSAWGWSDEHEGTSNYAQALQKAGFATLELRMFPTHGSAKTGGPAAYLPELFGSLNYLASNPDIDPKRIGVAGYSFGGLLALVAATTWANKTYGKSGQQFAAHAPFYPICWVLKANAQGRRSPVPTDAWMEWTGVPIRIFAGAIDDYDNRDPKSCEDAVKALPESQQRVFSVKVYPEATHGWDQKKGASFFEKLACNGRGCNNTNQPNSQVADQSTKDLIEFMSSNLAR
jgi:dienelactone hydrolase